ncbi:UBP1-associated protein 2A [Amborella trichopoda]|uniref:RRM domain-containing protein n=1 Tax=Amborella trichopoda TaxID=13333 RepID=W1NFP8_AMBTC|nr:UBP1-associated protein 2A [Amborella trichopoda]XP_011621667.1 UBP1-associated protein 2A [Amborella trichopoda]XP_020520784.1 UBP1-associated protein 2A [Amborella trichopoda]XP_020520787.1 UBP1-associated protein 2A [Amborella trichopoda]XP_020520793.1 UBP1-associated protein 2A [Amborella trichopoda]ERM94283.1 hypothetical protein AMTR_s00010p00228950 [Amborella trichopoda]|eukprot:XP_006827046.1 UBP1-associated protein 2A [Amborella trichopoda]
MGQKRKADQDHNPSSSDSEEEAEPEAPHHRNSIIEEGEEEDIDELLEPFTKDQLVELIKTAISLEPNVLNEARSLADRDPSHRKLFVHGLGWDTTSETLTSTFSSYGEIEDCNVVSDKSTGKSKGYGFILFKHRHSAKKALISPQKKIDGRMTACQFASSGPTETLAKKTQNPTSNENLARKIYVGNVLSDIAPEKIHTFFSKYGEIEEGPLGFDRNTGKAKGFALFVYKSSESAKRALAEPNKIFEGHKLYCQRATDNTNKQKNGPMGLGLGPGESVQSNAPALIGQAPGQGLLVNGLTPGLGPAFVGLNPMAAAFGAVLNPALAMGQNGVAQSLGLGGNFGNLASGYGNFQGLGVAYQPQGAGIVGFAPQVAMGAYQGSAQMGGNRPQQQGVGNLGNGGPPYVAH